MVLKFELYDNNIMKIGEFNPIKNATALKKRGGVSSSSSTSFADVLGAFTSEEPASASSMSDVAAASAVNTMLSLQEISEEDVRRKKLILQGKSLLDTLEAIRSRLLTGTISRSLLSDLGRQLSIQRQGVADPHLITLMDEIELRAAVELAKLEKAAEFHRPENKIENE